MSTTGAPRITIAEIQSAVCARFDLPRHEMRSPVRSNRIARPRQLAMYLARELTDLSLPQIGRQFGGRDHSTVLHGIARSMERIATDQDWREHEREVRAALGGGGRAP